MAQMVKRLPTMQETQVQSLGREGPLEKEMAIHSNTLAWKIPWMEEHDSPWGRKESDMTEVGNTHVLFLESDFLHCKLKNTIVISMLGY